MADLNCWHSRNISGFGSGIWAKVNVPVLNPVFDASGVDENTFADWIFRLLRRKNAELEMREMTLKASLMYGEVCNWFCTCNSALGVIFPLFTIAYWSYNVTRAFRKVLIIRSYYSPWYITIVELSKLISDRILMCSRLRFLGAISLEDEFLELEFAGVSWAEGELKLSVMFGLPCR